MLDRIWKVSSRSDRHGAGSRPGSKHTRRQPLVEVLEGRQLLTASLAPITNFTVPAGQGYQLTLDGSGTTDPQTFTPPTSSNPDIKVSVAPPVVGTQGQFWTVTVSHTPAPGISSDVTINNETMTFQLFGDLTPQTVDRIVTLTNDKYYTTTAAPLAGPGKYFPRITSVSNAGVSVLQGGASGSTLSTSSASGLTPLIAVEPVQQLAFTGQNQLAMANTGGPPGTLNTDAQFFITNGTVSQSIQQQWDHNYTIFGQLVSGQQTVTDLSKVAVTTNSTGEDSQPITPVVISVAPTLSSTNSNGVLLINTTSATPGQTATITVTATDPTDNTTATQSFTVTTAGNTNAVRLIDNDVLVVTPPPRTDHGTDKIEVSQQANPTGTGAQNIVVTVNGVPDLIQPPATSLLQIIVFGGKASTDIQVDPNVLKTIPITLDGGHGGHNVIQAGAGPTREHGWFGHTLLIGGTGSDALIGRKGFVRFKPTTTTNLIYAGAIKPRFKHRTVPPSGTYYRFVNGRLVPVLTT